MKTILAALVILVITVSSVSGAVQPEKPTIFSPLGLKWLSSVEECQKAGLKYDSVTTSKEHGFTFNYYESKPEKAKLVCSAEDKIFFLNVYKIDYLFQDGKLVLISIEFTYSTLNDIWLEAALENLLHSSEGTCHQREPIILGDMNYVGIRKQWRDENVSVYVNLFYMKGIGEIILIYSPLGEK